MCGIIGIFNNKDAAQLAALGLLPNSTEARKAAGWQLQTVTLSPCVSAWDW